MFYDRNASKCVSRRNVDYNGFISCLCESAHASTELTAPPNFFLWNIRSLQGISSWPKDDLSDTIEFEKCSTTQCAFLAGRAVNMTIPTAYAWLYDSVFFSSMTPSPCSAVRLLRRTRPRKTFNVVWEDCVWSFGDVQIIWRWLCLHAFHLWTRVEHLSNNLPKARIWT